MVKWGGGQGPDAHGKTWPEVWSPEKMSRTDQGDGDFRKRSRSRTIDCYDFTLERRRQEGGWNRDHVIPTRPAGRYEQQRIAPVTRSMTARKVRRPFLYNPGDRILRREASDNHNVQFADLSAVFPARYHSVRSLGRCYSPLPSPNRMRCKFNRSGFSRV